MKRIIAFLLATFLLTACSTSNSSTASSQQGSSPPATSVRQLENRDFPAPAAKNMPIVTMEYNFGSQKLESAPIDVNYEVRGTLSLPAELNSEPYPLVLILHGSHENIAEDARYDTGFTYLCEALAKNGYVVASLDLNVAYLWHLGENDLEKTIEITHHHLAALQEMSQTPTAEYSALKNKIDFTKIVLVGHSRGGGSIFEIASYEAENDYPISGLIAVAPALMAQRREFADIPSHILVPELDGDLTDLQGYYLSYAVRDSHQKSITSVTLLEQANHNFFNQTLVEQDRNDARWFGPVTEKQLTAPQQQEFLIHYTLSMLESIFTNQQTIFNSGKQTPTSLFGKNAPVIFYQPNREPVLDIFDTAAVKPADKTNTQHLVDSWFFKYDTAHFFDSITLGSEEYQTKDLLQISWEEAAGTVQLLPAVQDFSNRESLFLELALDSAQFETDPQVVLSITITDSSGNSSTVVLPQQEPALRFVPGEKETIEIADTYYYAYSKKTPITGCWVPLEYWKNIQLSEISSVTLTFESEQNKAGAVMLEGCYLY